MPAKTKTTIYLPDDLKIEVTRIARAQGVSEAEVIREAIRRLTQTVSRPAPRGGLFSSGDPTMARRVDELLEEGFGQWEAH